MISCFDQLYKTCQRTSYSPFHTEMHGPAMGRSCSTDTSSAATWEHLRRIWQGKQGCAKAAQAARIIPCGSSNSNFNFRSGLNITDTQKQFPGMKMKFVLYAMIVTILKKTEGPLYHLNTFKLGCGLGNDKREGFDMNSCWKNPSAYSASVGVIKVTHDMSEINSASSGKHCATARDWIYIICSRKKQLIFSCPCVANRPRNWDWNMTKQHYPEKRNAVTKNKQANEQTHSE